MLSSEDFPFLLSVASQTPGREVLQGEMESQDQPPSHPSPALHCSVNSAYGNLGKEAKAGVADDGLELARSE